MRHKVAFLIQGGGPACPHTVPRRHPPRCPDGIVSRHRHHERPAGLRGRRNVRVKTLCDMDEQLFPLVVDIVNKRRGIRAVTEWELGRVLEM